MMTDALELIFNITIIIFMAGNLLEVGLTLEVAEARAAIRNLRFLLFTLFWCFVFGPAIALLVTKVMPLGTPYALGLTMLGLAPCTPALPLMVKKAGGSKAYMSALMVIAYAGTVILMPLLTPVLAAGLSANAWAIAKPLLFFVALPFLIGMLVRFLSQSTAEAAAPIVKRVTGINTLLLIVIMVWLYRFDLFSSVGTFAAASQVIYYAILGAAAYALSRGLSYEQKSVITIGVCTRNVGPALAPLVALPNAPPQAIAMCILAVLLGAIVSGFAAAWTLRYFFSPAVKQRARV